MQNYLLKLFLLVWLYFLSCSGLMAQIYDEHFGEGNTIGVSVSSSDPTQQNEGSHSLSGTGYFPDLEGASRFLAQASLGYDYSDILEVSEQGINAWIDQQISQPYETYLTRYRSMFDEINDMILEEHPDASIGAKRDYMSFVFYESIFKDDDLLRNKAAFALNQILVLSTSLPKLNERGYGAASYYDIIFEGAFGNFRDVLDKVTHHILMGYFLSHFNNSKGNPEIGTMADENYAREIMQLFSIGLFELNLDGTYKLDDQGERIPTYDIVDVQELAKVFTGLSGSAYDVIEFPFFEGQTPDFGKSLNRYIDTLPMVKSNPTPAYVKRVALAFNNNGKGERGDLEAVFKAVLLDPEARDCKWLDDPKNGRLRQPIERFANIFRAFKITSPSGRLWFSDLSVFREKLEQAFMASPTVFNYFTPFYAEDKHVKPNEMLSPEFEILHAVTVINYFNLMEGALKNFPFRNRSAVNLNNSNLVNSSVDFPYLNFEEELSILEQDGVEPLIDRLDLMLCQGTLSDSAKNIILDTLNQLIDDGGFTDVEIIHNAIYFIAVSPDYMILE